MGREQPDAGVFNDGVSRRRPRPRQPRPDELRPGELRPGELRPDELTTDAVVDGTATSSGHDTDPVLRLQQTVGNAALSTLLTRRPTATRRPDAGEDPHVPVGPTPVVAREPVGAVITGDVLPPPLLVTWGGDPFAISFTRSTTPELLDVTITYRGSHPFEGRTPGGSDNAWRASVRVGRQPVRPRVRNQTSMTVVVDLYGDASEFVRIGDRIDVDRSPAGPGRRHQLSAWLTQFAGGESGSVVVRDPAAARGSLPAAAPEDRPGLRPELSSVPGDFSTFEGVIDGDGDQRKELAVRIARLGGATAADTDPVRVRLVLRRVADGGQLLDAVGELPVSSGQFFFAPMVTSVSDGDQPTTISLDLPGNRQRITVSPPRPGPSPRYVVRFAGIDVEVPAPGPQGELGRVSAAGTAGHIIVNDVELGAYADRFRVSLQWRGPDRALLGLAPLFRGTPAGGYGVEVPASGTLRCQIVEATPVNLGFDLTGDGRPDLRIYDTLSTPSPDDTMPERDRDHLLRVVGSPVGGERSFRFPIRRGQPLPVGSRSAEDRVGSSNALAVTGLNEQRRNATYAAQLDEYEMAMMKIRGEAARSGAIPSGLYQAWASLSADMIKLRPQLATGSPQAALQTAAAGHAQALFTTLAAETVSANQPRFYQVGYGMTNPYTGEKTDHVVTMPTKTTGAGPELAGHLVAGRWREAYDGYQTLVSGLDRWVAKRLADTVGDHAELTKQAEFLVSSRSELAKLEKHNPTRVLATFQPDQKFSSEGGWVEQIPLNLYYYRDDDTWYLQNLTNPAKPYHCDVPATDGQTEPPAALFAELNDSDRLPEGVIHYEIPGSYGGEVTVRSQLTFRKFLTYLGIGLAVLGLTLATAGTGTVAVAGSWALAGSAVAGGLSAALDIVDKAEHGDLTATTAIIDIAQIVGAIAGVTALRSGMVARGGMVAASEGNPFVGEAARTAARAHQIYLISTATRISADVVTVVTMGVEAAAQLDEIEKGPGDRTSKDRAKALLLAQLAVTGGLVTLSIKGELPSLGNGHRLTLFTPKGSTVPIALVEGSAAPGALKFSQSSIRETITDGSMTVEQLADSMRREGWKGDPLHVVVLDDGSQLSLDNRRLWAAHQAGLTEVPIWYHSPKEEFPREWINDGFILRRYSIYELPDGSFTTTKSKDAKLRYPKESVPDNLFEAALFRTADQGNLADGTRFPIWGSYELPRVRRSAPATPPRTE